MNGHTLTTSAEKSTGCTCSEHCAAAPSLRLPDAAVGGRRSTFRVPGMDCPSEERLIRMALDGAVGLRHIGIDLATRTVTLHHDGPLAPLQAKLAAVGFGADLLDTDAAGTRPEPAPDRSEAGVLRTLLAINAAMFVFELASGLWAQSTGLIADALDMLADASVYGLSLYAVGRSAAGKLRVAHLSGWLQLLLAGGALAEVVRRAVSGSEPEPLWMSGVALLALAANVVCLLRMARHRDGGAHMKASWIFSTNDVLANAGVIIAGGLVAATGTRWPDLLIGTAIALLVASGALRILKLKA